MLRVYADFNSRTSAGECWILTYAGENLDEQVKKLQLAKGDRILLYQDENDFEVIATLDFKYISLLLREAWVAAPDWTTLVRLQSSGV